MEIALSFTLITLMLSPLILLWTGDKLLRFSYIYAAVATLALYLINHPSQRAIDDVTLGQRVIGLYLCAVVAATLSLCVICVEIRERRALHIKTSK